MTMKEILFAVTSFTRCQTCCDVGHLLTTLYSLLLCFIVTSCGQDSLEETSPEPSPSPCIDSTRLCLDTGLPVCYVTTRNNISISSRDEYVTATMHIVHNGKSLFEDTLLRIKGRGQASWTSMFPKRPYKLKLSSKHELLGMPANKHFVLLANYTDKSLMRTAIGFKVGELLEREWTPQSRFVELVLNGKYQGNYQLTESVRAGKHRINVSNSGLILEYLYPERVVEEPFYFITKNFQLGYGFKYPDEDDMTEECVKYAADLMDRFERQLTDSNCVTGYTDFIDLESWAKWYYHLNILMQREYNTYLVKYDNTDNSKICLGPLWDFEWSLGVGYYDGKERPCQDHYLVTEKYFRKLIESPLFIAEVTKIHRQYGKRVREGVLRYYEELSDYLRISQKLNFKCWPILDKRISVGGYPLGSWEKEVECDRQFFIDHYDYIDMLINCNTRVVRTYYSTRRHC